MPLIFRTNVTNAKASSRQLDILLWLLVSVPVVVTLVTEANKRILIWNLRVVDFLDLVLLAPFFLVTLLSLHRVVFREYPDRPTQWLSIGLIGVFMYGYAMHLTGNAINTYSTEIHDYLTQIPSDTHELIYFFDEYLSHWLLYSALFLLFGLWTVECDIYGRTWSAAASGAVLGVSYAIAIIESSQPWMGFTAAGWLLGCSIWGAHHVKVIWRKRWRTHPLTAFSTMAAILLSLGEMTYAFIVSGFIEPSRLGM